MLKNDLNVKNESLMGSIVNKISAKALGMNEGEIKKLSKLLVNQPNLTKASMSMASSLKCRMNWDVIITSLTILTMDSVNYTQIAKDIKLRLPKLNDEYIVNEVEELYAHITSIVVENNRSELTKVESKRDSRYKFSTIAFRKLMEGEATLDEFHKDILELMISVIKDNLNKTKYKYLAV